MKRGTITKWLLAGLLGLQGLVGLPGAARADHDDDDGAGGKPKYLYIWAGDQARVAPDFLAVIDFDEDSKDYGKVIKTVPMPPPGNVGNEPHHCHLSADKKVLGCGGLLSLLKGQPGVFFFDVTDGKNPKFLFSANPANSAITDDFMPLPEGGFLVTMMGSATGGSPGRVAEFDGKLRHVASHFGPASTSREWPYDPPLDGFNPHGIDIRPEMNLMVTADFIEPASTLNVVPGGPVVRSSIRVWDYNNRLITKTIPVPGAIGTMDTKLIPGDPLGRAVTAGMFDGHVYLVDPNAGTATSVFDCESITPHVDVPVRGGMVQLMALPRSGDRLLFASFQAGQVGMLDITDRSQFKQLSVVSLGMNAGPHNIFLTDSDRRAVVVDYFLNEDDFGKIHFEGDHQIHVLKVGEKTLERDPRFNLDFDTAFPTGPARPHGGAVK